MKKIISIFAMLALAISVNSQTSVTSTTVETIVKVDSVCTLDNKSVFDMDMLIIKTGTVQPGTVRFYVNDHESLVGASLLGFYTIPAVLKSIPVNRSFYYSGDSLKGYSKTVSNFTDASPTGLSISSTPVYFGSKKYIIVSIQPSTVNSDVFNLEYLNFSKK